MAACLPDAGLRMDRAEAEAVFSRIVDGDVPDEALAPFLVALAERGETAIELAAAAAALRARMRPVVAPDGAIDLCGTGGDGTQSLNVSTAAAFVVAAAGVPVAKHGNRAQSSRTGAADVLEALGADLALPPDRVEACLAEVGIAFLFAPSHHPAMARVAPVRRALKRRTIFNLLGPLANPAGVRRQMVGVFAEAWLHPVAEALAHLGSEAALVVHGGGLDEIAVHAPSRLVWMRGGVLRETAFDPDVRGLGLWPADAIQGGDAAANAAALAALFEGAGAYPGGNGVAAAYRAIVVANAAAALKLAGRAPGWPEAIALAAAMIDSGAARDCLARFVAFR
jgi:anthranilate phosphoribosyltransferase